MADETPGLWTGDGASSSLLGVRCAACRSVFFPPQRYGCTVCGADELEDLALEPAGVLRSFAVVNLHPTRPTPYTIGEIELDAGPVVHALLEAGDAPPAGSRVRGAATDEGFVFRA